jgi:hypothetical protein
MCPNRLARANCWRKLAIFCNSRRVNCYNAGFRFWHKADIRAALCNRHPPSTDYTAVDTSWIGRENNNLQGLTDVRLWHKAAQTCSGKCNIFSQARLDALDV